MHREKVACGVAVIVTWRRQVLFGRRSTAGGQVWQLPGGWIESGESPESAARREVAEETGLTLGPLSFVGVTSNVFSAQEHSISLYFEAECDNASQLTTGAESACADWQWRDWDAVDGKLYLPLLLFRQTDYRPFSEINNQAQVSF